VLGSNVTLNMQHILPQLGLHQPLLLLLPRLCW
jgi:hypothetical protein